MIPTGRTTPEPKHKRSSVGIAKGLMDVRDYAAHVCPGQHCAGRGKAGVHHRHGAWPVHYLTPTQAARATEYSGRVR